MNVEQQNSHDELFLAFIECQIPAGGFDHKGHVQVAWIALQKYPLESAIEVICSGIFRLASQFGVPEKYHRTLSEALVRIIAHQCGLAPSLTWEEFVERNALLMKNPKRLLAQYYSDSLLYSEVARSNFVSPDIQQLPSM